MKQIFCCVLVQKKYLQKKSRSVYKIADAEKESLTVLFIYNAAGILAPPMLMFAYKEGVLKKIIENTPKG